MGLFGARLLLWGTSEPEARYAAVRPEASTTGLGRAAGALMRELETMSRSFAGAHPTVVSIHAVSEIAFGLLLLYTVAAVMCSDQRARAAALAAAWVGIAYHI